MQKKHERFQDQIRRLKLTARRLIHRFGEGSFRTTFVGRGIEFAALREYVAGDDIRQIEWNTTARRGAPYVKTFMEERDLSLIVVVDLSSSMDIKKPVVLRLVSLLGCLAEIHEDRIGCLGFTDRIEFFQPPVRRPIQADRMLHMILTARSGVRNTSVNEALKYLQRILKKQALLFIISDFLDRQFERTLLSLAQKHEVVGVHLYHPLEKKLPKSTVVDCYDPESGKRFLLDSYDRTTAERFERRARTHQEFLQQIFARGKADLLVAPSDSKADLHLIEFLRRRQSTRSPIQIAV